MGVVDASGQEGFEFLDITQPLQPVATSAPCTQAGGSVTATFNVVQFDLFWEVTKIAVSCTSTTTTAAFVYVDVPLTPINVIASSIAGNSDQDDCATPIIILGTKQLQVVWTGCSLGAVGSARLQVLAKKMYPAPRR